MNNNKPLTWDEVANVYDSRHSGRKARTMPMDVVFDWVASQDDFFVGDDDCLYRKTEVKDETNQKS